MMVDRESVGVKIASIDISSMGKCSGKIGED
jgi:hypothetical protein